MRTTTTYKPIAILVVVHTKIYLQQHYSVTLRGTLASMFSLSFGFGIKLQVPPLMDKIKAHIVGGVEGSARKQ